MKTSFLEKSTISSFLAAQTNRKIGKQHNKQTELFG
jgi:hypothetical protein